jgi:hypothetical protein
VKLLRPLEDPLLQEVFLDLVEMLKEVLVDSQKFEFIHASFEIVDVGLDALLTQDESWQFLDVFHSVDASGGFISEVLKGVVDGEAFEKLCPAVQEHLPQDLVETFVL